MLVFSLVNYESFLNIELKWLPEIKQHAPHAKYILVGAKHDLRRFYFDATIHKLDTKPVLRAEAEQMASKIGALCYVETSARDFDVDNAFHCAVRIAYTMATAKKEKKKQQCSTQ